MAPKIAIAFYSMYGHIRKMAEAEKKGIEKAGGTVDLFQVAETLPQDILDKLHAPPQSKDVTLLQDPAQLEPYDGILLGIPTRYGNFPAQWKTFWDKTGQQWAHGGYYGKMAGVFISTAGPGGGQESTAIAAMSTLAHHGIIYVPFGYAKAFSQIGNLEEVHGGSPWGAGTYAASDGSRQPTALELEMAEIQGENFYKTVAKFTGGSSGAPKSTAAAATTTAQNGSRTANGDGPEKREKSDKEGPCGLPRKCVIL